jgi:hypothetical protein
MTKEQAAKYFLVGWIKNWDMSTLANSIMEKNIKCFQDEDYLQIKKMYPFMSSNKWMYRSHGGKGTPVRAFISNNYPKLSNALWNTTSDSVKLSFYEYVCKQKCLEAVHKSKFTTKERGSNQYYKKKMLALTDYGYEAQKEYAQKMNGTHWNTVK